MDNLSANILLVDDEPFFLSVVSDNLRHCGFKDVISCSGGEEALGILRKRAIDLVISDINMSPMSGLKLVHLIRIGEVPNCNDLPIIFLTGASDRRMVTAAAALRIDGFVRKPVAINQLKTKVERALASRPVAPLQDSWHDIDDLTISEEESFKSSSSSVKPSAQEPTLQTPRRFVSRAEGTSRSVAIHDLQRGMRLQRDVVSSDGTLILRKDEPLSKENINRLRGWSATLNMTTVKIRVE